MVVFLVIQCPCRSINLLSFITGLIVLFLKLFLVLGCLSCFFFFFCVALYIGFYSVLVLLSFMSLFKSSGFKRGLCISCFVNIMFSTAVLYYY